MKEKKWYLTDLFNQFIKDSYTGKRLKPDGKKIKVQTIENYKAVLLLLVEYEGRRNERVEIKIMNTKNQRIIQSQKRYWQKFYFQFTEFLYGFKNCFDNYVGMVVKTIRIFFNYLKKEKFLLIGEFFKHFYVCKEEGPIITLLPDQLRFLINNVEFDKELSPSLKRCKDIFIFGCTVALRFSDLFNIRRSDLEYVGKHVYLAIRSIKTGTSTRIKLPDYAMAVIKNFQDSGDNKMAILPSITKNQFNKNIKRIAEKAGWVDKIGKTRAKRGKSVTLHKTTDKKEYRFCDLLSSHTMRKTGITTLLMLGVPELVVRKVSGHSQNSKAFYRYVNLAQSYLDAHVDNAFEKLIDLPIDKTSIIMERKEIF